MSWRLFAKALIAIAFLSQSAFAEAPVSSLRPDARPGSTGAAERPADMAVALAMAGLARSPLPVPRPPVAPRPGRVVLASTGAAVRLSPAPAARPRNLVRRRTVTPAAVRSQPSPPVATGRAGAVCGDKTIRGTPMSAIPGKLKGCGVAHPVKITSVDGVALSQPATVNCDTAKALKRWVSQSVKPTVGRLGGGVKSLRVVGHYSCRTRNHRPGAKISEHGRGNAIDIAAITLANGVSLTVLKGWRDSVQGKILRKVHAGACGPFGTVLGPDADRYHQDHFHFDVARHRGGAYCK